MIVHMYVEKKNQHQLISEIESNRIENYEHKKSITIQFKKNIIK